MTLAKKIVQLRENANISQKELAQKLRVSTGTVAEWESEDSTPSFSDISKLSTFFSFSTDVLIKETETVETADNFRRKTKRGLLATLMQKQRDLSTSGCGFELPLQRL